VAYAQNYVLVSVLCTEVLFTALSAAGENGRKQNQGFVV